MESTGTLEKKVKQQRPARQKKQQQAARSTSRARTPGISKEKLLCWITLVVAGLLGLLFLIDLFSGFPFAGASTWLDIFGILSAGLLVYVCVDTLMQLK